MNKILEYFRTTTKGYIQFKQLSQYFILDKDFYINSFAIQILFAGVLFFFFLFSIYRAAYRIEKKEKDYEEVIWENQQNQIYENESQKIIEEPQNQQEQDNYEEYQSNDEYQQQSFCKDTQNNQNQYSSLISITVLNFLLQEEDRQNWRFMLFMEQKLVRFCPFLIPYIITNNLFTCQSTTSFYFIFTIILYIVFNIIQLTIIEKKSQKIKILLQSLFIIPIVICFYNILTGDQDFRK